MALPGDGTGSVRVKWTANAQYYTRCYRRYLTGAWSLITTKNPGVSSWSTGYVQNNSYSFGVSHYDPSTGLESAIVNAGNGLL